MSQQNAEIVRTAVAAINRGDLDSALEAAHQGFEDEARVVVGTNLAGGDRPRLSACRVHIDPAAPTPPSVKLYQSEADALEAVGLRE